MGSDYYEQFEECEAYADCLPLGVGKGTHIRGAIVDKNARIGAHACVCIGVCVVVCVCALACVH